MENEEPIKVIKHITTYKGKLPGEQIVINEVTGIVTMTLFTDTGGKLDVQVPMDQASGVILTYITALGLTGLSPSEFFRDGPL